MIHFSIKNPLISEKKFTRPTPFEIALANDAGLSWDELLTRIRNKQIWVSISLEDSDSGNVMFSVNATNNGPARLLLRPVAHYFQGHIKLLMKSRRLAKIVFAT